VERPQRRRFTSGYDLRILREVEERGRISRELEKAKAQLAGVSLAFDEIVVLPPSQATACSC
jgi:hypothetical protein